MAVKRFYEPVGDFRTRNIGEVMTSLAKERAESARSVEKQMAQNLRVTALSQAIQAMGLLSPGERTVTTLIRNAKAIEAFLKGGR